MAVGCAQDLRAEAPIAVEALDEPWFRCRVQPVLTKTCGMLACHGSPVRFFVVYGRNRLRMSDLERDRNAFLTDDEGHANWLAAAALVVPGDVGGSLLLQKALDERLGGRWHRGAEIYGGGDVFQSEDEPEWQALVDWVDGATEDPGCIEPGSEL